MPNKAFKRTTTRKLSEIQENTELNWITKAMHDTCEKLRKNTSWKKKKPRNLITKTSIQFKMELQVSRTDDINQGKEYLKLKTDLNKCFRTS